MSEKEPVLYIVMPAYNESSNIPTVVEEWYPIIERHAGNGKSRLVVINDGSKDETLAVLQKLAKKYPLLKVLDRPNAGHGATVQYGYRFALQQGADYVFQTDSDGQTRPSEFEEFWRLRRDYDMVIGHRKGREDGWARVVVTKTLRATVRLEFGVFVTDANTPFRLMSRQSLEKCLPYVPETFNLANVVLTVVYHRLGLKVKYLPITFRPRQGGKNSINLRKIIGIGKNALVDFRKIDIDLKKAGI